MSWIYFIKISGKINFKKFNISLTNPSLAESKSRMIKISRMVKMENLSALQYKIKFWNSFNIRIIILKLNKNKIRLSLIMTIKKYASKKLKKFLCNKVRVLLIWTIFSFQKIHWWVKKRKEIRTCLWQGLCKTVFHLTKKMLKKTRAMNNYILYKIFANQKNNSFQAKLDWN